jgi:hypothetical protein
MYPLQNEMELKTNGQTPRVLPRVKEQKRKGKTTVDAQPSILP